MICLGKSFALVKYLKYEYEARILAYSNSEELISSNDILAAQMYLNAVQRI